MQIPLLPFEILALAPFGPVPDPGAPPELVDVDLATLDDALAALGPRFHLPLDKALCPEGGLTLQMSSIKDFRPDQIVKNNDYLGRVIAARAFVKEQAGADPAVLVSQVRERWPDVPIDTRDLPSADEAKSASQVDDILAMVAMPGGSSSGSSAASRSLGDQLDGLLTEIMTAIFDNLDFRLYEAAWRGLEAMLKKSPVKEGGPVKVRIGKIAPGALDETLPGLVARLADQLPNLILIDAGLDAGNLGVGQTTAIADFADNLLTPTAAWITSQFFHIDDWADLGKKSYIKHHLEDAAYAKWRKLAEHPGANWLTLLVNRFLTRAPYGDENRAKPVAFQESAPLWISPVYALGALAARSVVEHGWPSRLTDYHTINIEDLVVTDQSVGGPAVAEVVFSEDRIIEFTEVGLTPLVGPLRKDFAFIPKEATLAGGSLKFQLFFSRVLGFLFWCKENLPVDPAGDVAATLKQAFILYWERTGQQAPDDLEIAVAGEGQGGIPLNIQLTPPRAVLPGGGRLEFGFTW